MNRLEKIILSIFLLAISGIYAQVGVGTRTPNPDAMLEVSATNKGLLLPRVALSASTVAFPMSAHTAGMIIFNTANVADVTPGYYYNDGNKWLRLASDAVSEATTTVSGKIKLAGDLGGSADAPTVPGLALKANSSDVTTGLDTKENASNKSTDVTLSSNSDIKFPTEKAVKTYVDVQVSGGSIADASATIKGKIQLTGDLAGTAAAPTVPGLALKEDATNKSATTSLGNSDILFPTQNAVKTYVDTAVSSATIADADTATKGKIQLAGDLAGTATAPTVPGLALKEDAINKSATTSLGNSDILFPTQNAVKTYVDTKVVDGITNDVITSAPTQNAVYDNLALKAPIASPSFTGSVAIETNTPDASAVLDINSTNKGFLPPRMTTIQRDLITSPAKGLVIYNITTNQQQVNTGTSTVPNWVGSNAIISPIVIGDDSDFNNVVESSAPYQRVAFNGDGSAKQLTDTQFVFGVDNFIIGKLYDVDGTGTAPVIQGDTSYLSRGSLSLFNSTSRAAISMNTYTNANNQSSQFTGYRARGTTIAPTAVIGGDRIVKFSASALKAINEPVYNIGSMDIYASESFTSTSSPTYISFNTTPTNSTTSLERMRILSSGNVAIGTTSPQTSAALDVSSTTMGFLPPRMTSSQFNGIINPAEGLVIYCNDCTNKGLRVFNGTSWQDMSNNIAPKNTLPPVITTNPVIFNVGDANVTFNISNGTWTGSPSPVYTYSWYYNGALISGASTSSYSPNTIQSGSYSCKVTATNSVSSVDFSVSFISSTQPPVNTVAPVIANNNGTLSVSNTGTWNGGNTYTYQWKKAGINISGATNSSYQVPVADYGTLISCDVSNSNNAGTSTIGSNTITINYLLSNLSSNAALAYSLRKIGSAANSAIKVRRSSDNSTSDIGFDSYGNLDSNALTSFVGTSNGFVETWYDQSGNGKNATQTTAANQPQIVSSGNIIISLSKPSIQSVSTTSQLVASGYNGYTGTDISTNVVTTKYIPGSILPFTSIYSITATTGGTSRISINIPGNTTNSVLYSTPGSNVYVTMPTNGGAILNLIKSNTGIKFFQNGVIVDSSANAASISSNAYGPLYLFSRPGLVSAWNQPISEFIAFNATLNDTDKINLENNQGSYYNITVQ